MSPILMKYNRQQVETSAASTSVYACDGAAGCWLEVNKMFLNKDALLAQHLVAAVVLVYGADWLPERL